jgi:hypothetical protein
MNEIRFIPKNGIDASIKFLEREYALTRTEAEFYILTDAGLSFNDLVKKSNLARQSIYNYVTRGRKKILSSNKKIKYCSSCINFKICKSADGGPELQANACILYKKS